MRHLPRLLLGLATISCVALPCPTVRAEDAAPTKDESEKKDDKNPAQDLKLTRAYGLAWRKKRAEYWQKKSEETDFPGRWFFHVGRHWQEAREYEKAVAAFDKFFAYVPPKDDSKAVADNQVNRKSAMHHLIDIHFRMKQYAKSAETGAKYIEDYPDDGVVVAEVWDLIGQAQRADGTEDKAIASFSKSAEMKYIRGYIDLIDLHVAAGNVDAAKAAIEKYSGELAEKYKDLVAWTKALAEAIGTDAPPLDKAVSVAPSEAPKEWSQATILYRFGLQTNAADAKLENINSLKLKYSSKCVALGLATYQHYNVYSRKVEPELSKEDELKGFRELLSQSPKRIPGVIVVEPEFLDALKAKFDNQITIVDEKGKLRYGRANEEKPYDYVAAEIALKRIIGEK
jgi:tetratricopeptide (TPR) repeat protein